MRKYKNTLISIAAFSALCIMCCFSENVKNGAINGINLSLSIIIPSLFPFLFFSCLLVYSLKRCSVLLIYLISAMGGYPVGAKICEELYKANKISKKDSDYLKCFCFNAGPGFIISVVGKGIFGSLKIGLILYFAHILSSALIMIFLIKKIKIKDNTEYGNKNLSISDMFVSSMKNASESILNISSFVILFSVILTFFTKSKYFVLLLEVSNSVFLTKNIYIISFILGFGGFCIWLQIMSLSKESGINMLLFSLSRIIHGLLSVFFTYIFIKLFKIETFTMSTVSRSLIFSVKCDGFLFISLLIMFTVLVIQINNKNYSGNLIKDIV